MEKEIDDQAGKMGRAERTFNTKIGQLMRGQPDFGESD
jgi:hypothetical protein